MTTDTRPAPRTGTRPARRRTAAVVLRPDLFAIPLGLAALALGWSVTHTLLGAPRRPGLGRWLLAELTDPTFGPFTALPGIIMMLLGGALADYAGRPQRSCSRSDSW